MKDKIICPLTYTKCDISCHRYFNCVYKNGIILNEIHKEITKQKEHKPGG